MDEEFVIQGEPPWVVEIEGMRFATPELVCLLLQDVSEERDQLEAENERLMERLDVQYAYIQQLVADLDALREGEG